MFFSGRDETLSLSVDGHEHVVVRAHLQKFLLLEQLRGERNVREYLEVCGVPANGSGIDLLRAYNMLIRFNSPSVRLPLLTIRSNEPKKEDDTPWTYLNRHIVSWVYQVTSRAHISLTEALNLNIDDFFALLQEVLVDDQLDREWEWSLSEIGYQYDSNSKVSRLRPLERPVWMVKIRSKHTPKEIPEWLMPKGMINSLSNNASKS